MGVTRVRKFKKRVGGTLFANGSDRAMTGIDDGLFGQDQQLLVNRTQNPLERAAPQIGSADAAGKKRISGQQPSRIRVAAVTLLRGQIEGDASGRMPRGVQHIGREPSPPQRVPLPQQRIDTRWIGSSHADKCRLHVQMAIELHIVAVHQHRRAGGLLHLAQASDVVDMRVRADDGLHGEGVLRQDLQNPIGFIPGIDNEGFSRLRIADDRAIALQHADRQDFVDDFFVHGSDGQPCDSL